MNTILIDICTPYYSFLNEWCDVVGIQKKHQRKKEPKIRIKWMNEKENWLD